MKRINDLKQYEPLYIIGHRNPDVDTIFSSYLLSNILNYFGVKSYYSILNKDYDIDEYNKRIIDDYLDFNPVISDIESLDKYNFVLVDHNDPNQSVGKGSNIVFGLDHHKNCKILDNIIVSDLCCNCLHIYNYFKNIYSFNDKEKELIMIATLTDTLFFKSDRYKERDKLLVSELGVNINSEELLEKYFIETDLSMGIDKFLEKSDRNFTYFGINFSSSVVQSIGDKNDSIIKYKDCILNKRDNHLGMWKDLTNNKTYVFFKINGRLKEYIYNFIASRASTVIPEVINYLGQETTQDLD